MAILTVFNTNNQPLPLELEDYTETFKYAGDDALAFTIPGKHPVAAEIAEETLIQTQKNNYIVKIRDERAGEIEFTCALDLRDWDGRYWREYPVNSMTLSDRLAEIMPPNWTVQNAEMVTVRRTLDDGSSHPLKNMTSRTLLARCADLYGVQFNYNSISKTLYVVDPAAYQPTGRFLTDQLNLRSIGLTGNSTELITRLYPYGKTTTEGETSTTVDITSVNDGIPYIEDYSYTDKTIVGSWEDERYTDPQSLLDAARAKLSELAYPKRAYECDVAALEHYNRYDVVTLIDRVRKTQINHQIVELAAHPDPSKTVVTLASKAGRIETNIKQAAQLASAADQTANAALHYVNGSVEECKRLLEEQEQELQQEMSDLSGSLTGQIQDAIQAEQQRANSAYAPMPIAGFVSFTTAGSKQITVPYTNYNVTLTPSAAGNCWATAASKQLTIHTDTAMTVWYSVTERKP